jgi:hypothetical protein
MGVTVADQRMSQEAPIFLKALSLRRAAHERHAKSGISGTESKRTVKPEVAEGYASDTPPEDLCH